MRFLFLILFTVSPLALAQMEKPQCQVLSYKEFRRLYKDKNAKDYEDYVYSRPTIRNDKESLPEILLRDKFSYKDPKWPKVIAKINKINNYATGIFYLPPCFEPEEKVAGQVIEKVSDKTQEFEPKRWNLNFGLLYGFVHVKSRDQFHSSFDINFLKFLFSGSYKLKNELILNAGIGLNYFLAVSFKSDLASGKSNEINSYRDFFGSVSKKIGPHLISAKYDNINYMLNHDLGSKQRINPTRVDRLSFTEIYDLNNGFSLLGSVGYFHPIFSKASGYDMSAGVLYGLQERFSIYANYSFNMINKDQVENTSQAWVLGLNKKFE